MAGTSEEYGGVENKETSLPDPQSPYAISKLAMDYLGRWYAKTYKMNVVVTRAFNHTGPGRGEMYAESSFAKQIVQIERGNQDVLRHGNLEAVRNYTDVRDIVRAYALAIDLPSDVYNICSDQNISIGDVLKILCTLSDQKIKLRLDSSRVRPADFSFAVPSCEKFTKLTNWVPEYDIEQTLKDILDYWRAK